MDTLDRLQKELDAWKPAHKGDELEPLKIDGEFMPTKKVER